MPRINLYLPVGVKSAMDAVAQHRPNWSEVAQRAFVAEAARLYRKYGERVGKRSK